MQTPEQTDVARAPSASGAQGEPPGSARSQAADAGSDPGATGPLATWGDTDIHAHRDAWPRRGQLVGRYIALDRLGAGAMGVVWRAYDPKLDRKIALKLVRGTTGPIARLRLVREAQTLARLSHDNIVAVFDVGTEGDEVFVAMEWIDGRDLSAWLREGDAAGTRRPWREVVDVMLLAARGLQAAHDAGIVHRDFKPANVLLSHGGRVAVGDFGLARAEDDDGPAADGPAGSPDPAADPWSSGDDDGLTATGTTVGTPAYMAPEQHHRARLDGRADQYAWAVAVYEGLYGERPFATTDVDRLAALKTKGVPMPDHRKAGVPRRLWPVLARALSPDPQARFPTMSHAAAALRRSADAPRRRARVAVALGLVTSAAVVVARPWDAGATPCAGVDATADVVWSDEARERVATAITATGVGYAASTAELATAALDRAVSAWRDARQSACAATWIRGEQSAQALDARMGCLDRVLDRTAAAITALSGVDATRVDRVAEVIAALPRADRCDQGRASAPTTTADDPTTAALRRALDEANARLLVGDPRTPTVLDALGPLVVARGDDGLRAELELVRGQWLDQAGAAGDAAATLREATRLARLAGGARTETEAWIALVRSAGRTRQVEHGRFYGEIATALVEAHGGGDDLAADAALQLGVLAFTVGDDDEAAAQYGAALELCERAWGPSHPRTADVLAKAAGVELRRGSAVQAAAMLERAIAIAQVTYGEGHPKLATAMGNLGVVYAEQQRWDQALTLMRAAAQMLEAAWGPEHPSVGIAADSIGDVLRRAGRPIEAHDAFVRALAIFEQTFGPEHPATSSALLGLGQALIDGGRVDEARAPLERALRIAQPGRVPPVQTGDIQFHLAIAVARTDPGRARTLGVAALEVYRAELRPQDDRLPEIEAFLAGLPPS